MMNWNPYLSIESLIEACGEDHLDDITELEILFTSCTEIDSLQYCSSLTRLSMINNGLIVISNLYPVQETLKYLCLCDQQITRMENLHLPQLEKLYLYNNQIEEIRGLEHCTNLKILWLNQNQIRSISGLERCMYLEELQLHSNQIVNLNGIEAVRGSLSILGLADNLIATFDEIDKLQSMVALSEITFYDIHYGACPIYEQEGFREYTVLSLPNLQSLDGIRITPARVAAAQQTMEVHTNNMQIQLDKINAQYALDVTAVQVREKSEIDECIRIEESRRSELIDLSTRVSTYSQRISDEISRQENLFEHGLSKFSIASDHLLMESSEAVKSQQHNILHEYDRTASLVYILEYLETVRETMRNLLYQVSNTSNSNFKFEYVDRNTSKFHHFSQALSYNHTNINSPERPSIPVSFQNTINQKYNSAISPDVRLQNTHSNCQTELVHIYEINIRDCRKVTDQGVMTKIYTVLSFDQLYKFLSICHQGSEVSHLNELSDKSFVFFSNPGVFLFP